MKAKNFNCISHYIEWGGRGAGGGHRNVYNFMSLKNMGYLMVFSSLFKADSIPESF